MRTPLLPLLLLACIPASASTELRGADGQPWLREVGFGARLTDGASLSSSDARYTLSRHDEPGATVLQFRDSDRVLDLEARIESAGAQEAVVRLAVTNRSSQDVRLDSLTVIEGVRPSDGRFGKCIPNGLHSWSNPDIFRLLPEQSYDVSYWTVCVEEPTLAAGFTRGAHNVDRFRLVTEPEGLRVVAWAECDGVVLRPGVRRESDPVFVSAAPDALAAMERYARRAAEANRATLRFPSFATWCSWYAGWIRGGMYGYKGGLERGVADNIPLVARELAARGAGWMRIVDDTDEMPYGDWDDVTKALPGGFGGLVTQMDAAGIEPGIWLPLFLVSDKSQLWRDHPDWLGRNADGSIAMQEFYGNHCGVLDPSNPEVCEHLRQLGRSLRDRGFRYVMTDFLINGYAPPATQDPTVTKTERHRAGLEAFREGLGPEVYWLGCGAVLGPSMGLCDGMRISGDSFGNAPYAYLQSGSRWYTNHALWLNDPDAIVCRGNDPEWNRAWMTWMALSGQVLTYGDTLDDIAPEDLATYRRVFPPVDRAGRPLDLWENSPYLLWGLAPREGERLFGVFHFGQAGQEDSVELNLDEIAARIDAKPLRSAPDPWLLWDFWGERLLRSDGARLTLPVPSRGGSLFALREYLGRPQLLGTTGHFTMGALETSDVRWDRQAASLSMGVRGNAGDPTTLFVHLPPGWSLASATLGGRDIATETRAPEVLSVSIPALDAAAPLDLRFRGLRNPALSRPVEVGSPATWDPTQPRRREIGKMAHASEKLVAYLDVPGMAEDGAGPALRFLEGKPYDFPPSGGASREAASILFHEQAVRFQIRGMSPAKRYVLGLTWWDENHDGRIQSVTLVTPDGTRFDLTGKRPLPAWRDLGQLPETLRLELPPDAIVPGPVEVIVANDANVPNAVIGEIWLLEGDWLK